MKQSFDYCLDDVRGNEANLRLPNYLILSGFIFCLKKVGLTKRPLRNVFFIQILRISRQRMLR